MKRLLVCFFTLLFVVNIGLTGCSSAGMSGNLTGDYRQDTILLVDSLRTSINLPIDDPAKPQAQADTRNLINDFASRYRRDPSVANLASFTTMRTALNAIAGHYSSYPNRPMPDKLKVRLEQEFKQIEAALNRGA